MGGASIFTKLIFTVLLLTFTLTATLYITDYKQGQLSKLTSSMPPQVQEFAKKVDIAAAALTENLKKIAAQALIKAEELSMKVPIGEDRTLADVLFSSKEKV